MKSYSVFLVANRDLHAIRAVFGTVEPINGTQQWMRCNFDKDAEPPEDDVLVGDASLTEGYSAQLGEVVFVYGDTSVDGFVYEHARDGEMLRKLVWFPMLGGLGTAGWVCVDGEPEEWEAALFNAAQLERLLYNERMRYKDEGRADDFEEYEKQIKSEWASGRILEGRMYPECDGTVALLVERYYGVEAA